MFAIAVSWSHSLFQNSLYITSVEIAQQVEELADETGK